MAQTEVAGELGITFGVEPDGSADRTADAAVDLAAVNKRVLELADAQSEDIAQRLEREGVRLVAGHGRLDGPERVVARTEDGEQVIDADVVLIATGASPRTLPSAQPDGERIFTWEQVYALDALPEHLVVVGS